jgi:hypothetical protein
MRVGWKIWYNLANKFQFWPLDGAASVSFRSLGKSSSSISSHFFKKSGAQAQSSQNEWAFELKLKLSWSSFQLSAGRHLLLLWLLAIHSSLYGYSREPPQTTSVDRICRCFLFCFFLLDRPINTAGGDQNQFSTLLEKMTQSRSFSCVTAVPSRTRHDFQAGSNDKVEYSIARPNKEIRQHQQLDNWLSRKSFFIFLDNRSRHNSLFCLFVFFFFFDSVPANVIDCDWLNQIRMASPTENEWSFGMGFGFNN